jgi:ribonucleoside-triphosphate reductase
MNDIKTPWGPLGYVTFKRTYARKLNDTDTEELIDVVNRELKAAKDQLNINFSEEDIEYYKQSRLNLKWSVAGRFMWQLGTETVDKLGLASLQNCAFTIVDDPIKPFTWTFDMLCLGSGVGFNIQKKHVNKLPVLKNKIEIKRLDTKDADFIIPDSREGWVKLLEKVLKAHYYTGKGFTYSTVCIRSKGAPIKGFGGTASGPEELCWGINEIHKILNDNANNKLRPIHCLDIMNIIGFIVVSGNVRRSAELAIGDYDDIEFLKSKRWDLGMIPNWRSMSNNSIVAPENLEYLLPEYWETYNEGEPFGLINLELSKKVGRTFDFQYKDENVEGYNPCAEQSLEDKETCCLGMIYLPNIETYDELKKCLRLCYIMCKHSLALKCHHQETENIVHNNFRMGIGTPGYLQATEEQQSWLSDAYEWLREFDKQYSKEHNFPISIKLTTSKPDGTNALLPGVTPGCLVNPAGPYYIRRIIMASDSPLLQVCINNGYNVEPKRNFDGSNDNNSYVVEFPCSIPEHVPVTDNFNWKNQLDTIRKVQREWSDNAVSCTVTYKKEELEDIKKYLYKYFRNEIKSVSFLLYNDHKFEQAPYENITKEKYLEMISKCTPITSLKNIQDSFDVDDCVNGACPIK